MLAEGEKVGVKPKDEEELQKTLPELKLQMKALIARDIWDMSEYFAVMYEENPFVKKVSNCLNDNTRQKSFVKRAFIFQVV